MGALALILALVIRHDRQQYLAVEDWSRYRPMATAEGAAEQAIRQTFLATGHDDETRYTALFRYFLAGAVANASLLGGHIDYPGMGSVRGFQISGLEGFARTGMLLAAWIASGRPAELAPTANVAP